MNVPPPYGYPPPPVGGFGAQPAPNGYASPSYAPPPYFGYAQPPFAPQAQAGFAGQPGGTGAPALKWGVFGSFVGGILAFVASGGISAALDNDTGASIGAIFSIIGMLAFGAYFITALMWLYKSWEMLPAHARMSGNGTMVSPGQAIGFLFVPFYNLYWYFVCSAGMCTAYDRVLQSYGSTKRAPRGLAITAAIFQVIPYVNLVLGPFLWIAFMFAMESTKSEYRRLASGQRPMV
jgi:hypothetical protein